MNIPRLKTEASQSKSDRDGQKYSDILNISIRQSVQSFPHSQAKVMAKNVALSGFGIWPWLWSWSSPMCMQKQRALRLQNFFMALSEESSVPAWKLGLIRSKNVGSWNVDEVTDGIKCSGMPLQLGLSNATQKMAFDRGFPKPGSRDKILP